MKNVAAAMGSVGSGKIKKGKGGPKEVPKKEDAKKARAYFMQVSF